MIPLMGKRRNIIIAVCVSLLVLVALTSGPSTDTIKSIIPGHKGSSTVPGDGLPNTDNGDGETTDVTTIPVSQLHMLIPASQANIHLCYNVVSAVVNRYPVPMLLGWHGEGLMDAHKTHLAKLRAIQNYLHSLDDKEDDDLVVIVDGYDIIIQLPPEVMIERYFQMVEKADNRLAKRFGITVPEAHEIGLRQTIFWGPDKICWPTNWKAARCWAVPNSNLGDHAFGPKTGNGEMFFADPRWLNSGTVIGPAADMRKMIDATMDEIEATYDADFAQSESDQFYISNLWGRQEYYRSVAAANGGEVRGGPEDREVPLVREQDQETEYHITIDYESALFQTKAGYEPFFGYMQFNETGLKTKQDKDILDLGGDFKPYDIEMTTTVANAMAKLYDAIPEAHPGSDSKDWLSTVLLGTNFVSKHIYALWHCTGPKEWIDKQFPTLWFFPFVRPLLKAAVKASQSGEYITSEPIDNRHWVPKTWFPDNSEALGGAWTDLNGTLFVQWSDLCQKKYDDLLFSGEAGYQPTVEESDEEDPEAVKAAEKEKEAKEKEEKEKKEKEEKEETEVN